MAPAAEPMASVLPRSVYRSGYRATYINVVMARRRRAIILHKMYKNDRCKTTGKNF